MCFQIKPVLPYIPDIQRLKKNPTSFPLMKNLLLKNRTSQELSTESVHRRSIDRHPVHRRWWSMVYSWARVQQIFEYFISNLFIFIICAMGLFYGVYSWWWCTLINIASIHIIVESCEAWPWWEFVHYKHLFMVE